MKRCPTSRLLSGHRLDALQDAGRREAAGTPIQRSPITSAGVSRAGRERVALGRAMSTARA